MKPPVVTQEDARAFRDAYRNAGLQVSVYPIGPDQHEFRISVDGGPLSSISDLPQIPEDRPGKVALWDALWNLAWIEEIERIDAAGNSHRHTMTLTQA